MKTVLVIDDEVCILELIGKVLKDAECRVLEANSAAEGLKLATEKRPDLVLLDFLMPGISGVQLLQQLKASAATASIPVVMMSGSGADERSFRALAYDAAGYLMKPFSPAQLRSKLDEVLDATAFRPLATAESGIIAQLAEMVREG